MLTLLFGLLLPTAALAFLSAPTAVKGRQSDSLLSSGLQYAGFSQDTANTLDAVLPLMFSPPKMVEAGVQKGMPQALLNNATKTTANLFQDGARYALPAERAAVNAFNKAALADFRAAGGKIVNLQEAQPFFGRFNSADKIIELAPGRHLDTLTEELIHFRQSQEIGIFGRRAFPGGSGVYEADALDRLLEMGFTPRR